MMFNEKLIELRKKEGLSQEEFGYKLNVTRQTVSKWELGQTTPEMDKLIEISKIFNISVDELIKQSQMTTNQNQTIEDQPIEDQPIEKKSSKEKNTKIIIIIAIVAVIVLILIAVFTIPKVMGIFTIPKDVMGIFSKANSIIDDTIETQQNTLDRINEKKAENDADSSINENATTEKVVSEIEISKLKNSLQIYSGTKMGQIVTVALDKIITSNKTQDRKITVKYNEIETQDEGQIKNIKQEIETFDNYEITFEYDEEGFISKAIIEKI